MKVDRWLCAVEKSAGSWPSSSAFGGSRPIRCYLFFLLDSEFCILSSPSDLVFWGEIQSVCP